MIISVNSYTLRLSEYSEANNRSLEKELFLLMTQFCYREHNNVTYIYNKYCIIIRIPPISHQYCSWPTVFRNVWSLRNNTIFWSIITSSDTNFVQKWWVLEKVNKYLIAKQIINDQIQNNKKMGIKCQKRSA